MVTMGFEIIVSASEQLQTYDLDQAATGTGISQYTVPTILKIQVNIHYKKNYVLRQIFR